MLGELTLTADEFIRLALEAESDEQLVRAIKSVKFGE